MSNHFVFRPVIIRSRGFTDEDVHRDEGLDSNQLHSPKTDTEYNN